jgi:hypothetical protein
MNKLVVLAGAMTSLLFLTGCPNNTPPPPQIADCGPLSATVKGTIRTLAVSWSSPPKAPATAALSGDAKGGVTWTASKNSTGSSMDGATATGNATGSTTAPSFTATGQAGSNTLTVTGSITMGTTCTGSGTWTLNTSPPSSGTWTIP